MIDIAPKALRFARLAAEQQSVFSDDPEVSVLQQREEWFRRNPPGDRIRHYVAISEPTARFCIRVITALLDQPNRFNSEEWDGNDFAFLQSTIRSLRDQLAPATAPSL